MGHVVLELGGGVDDFHRAAAQHVARAHHQRVTDDLGLDEGFLEAARGGVFRLDQTELLDHLLETLAVFGAVDGVRRGADDRHTGGFELTRQLQRRLATELDDDTDRLFLVGDLQHVFQGDRLEVEAIGSVVVGRDRFRVAVDHDGLVAVRAHGEGGVDTAVVELDALADTVRTATQHHDLLLVADFRLALFLIGGVHVGGVGREFGGTGVDALVDRTDALLLTVLAEGLLGHAHQTRQARIAEALALETEQTISVHLAQRACSHCAFLSDQVGQLHQVPAIDVGEAEDLFDIETGTHGIGDVEDTLGTGGLQLALDTRHVLVAEVLDDRVETVNAGLHATQRLLQGFLEGTADGHDFADRLHLRGQAVIGLRELLEGEARNLGDDVIDGRLEGRRRLATGDVVLQLVQGVADGQLGGDLGDRETGRLGSQCRGTRHTRVHLDHDHAASVRTDAELDVGTAGLHADLTQNGQRCITHQLVFLVGQGLGRGDGDGVAGVHAHRVEVLDGADDDAVVVLVTNDLHLVFLPAQQRFVDQQLAGRRQLEAAMADLFEFFTVVRHAAAGTAHGEAGTDDGREAQLGLDFPGFFHGVRDLGLRARQTDLLHRLVEAITVFGLVDGVGVGADHLDTVLLEHAFALQRQRTVQCGLAAHGRQDGVRAFLLDDARHGFPGDRLDVGRIGHHRVGHDGCRVGVDQDDPVTLFTQGLAGLCAGIVELARLADDDGAGADDQDAFQVCTFRHVSSRNDLVTELNDGSGPRACARLSVARASSR